jgi:RimJ/RimL family protein N-acetyltransferase
LRVNIVGRIVTLRAVEERDLELLHKWANDPVTQDGIGEIHFPSSLDFHESWFRALKDDPLNQRFVVQAPDGGATGISSLMGIDWRNRHAWHGLVIGEHDRRGEGLGTDAVMATMRYAFEELGLERLEGAMIEYNQASIAFYCGMRLGWKQEGRRGSYFYRKGRYWDQVLVGITKSEYLSLVEETGYWR